MDSTYGEFQGTELDPSLDFDYDDEENDLPQILGLAAVVAALVGAVLVFIGRRRQPTMAERAQDILDTATKEGGKTLKAGSKSLKAASKSASKAVADAKLGELLDEALDRARKAGAGADLTGILAEARHKASKAVESVDLGKASKSARKEAAVATAELGALLGEALDKARDASSRIDISGLGDAAGEVRKQAAKVAANGHLPEIDVQKAGGFLDDLREKLVEAIESVRNDIAPKMMDTLKDDVLPSMQETAQQVAQKVQDDVVPAAQGAVGDVISGAQERAGRLAEEYDVGPRARKAAGAATEGAGALSNLLRTVAMAALEKMIDDILPGAKKAGGRAVKAAREDVFPAAAGTAGDAAQKVREDVFPRVGAAAAQAPDLLSDILNLAREKASEAFDKAQPMVSDATHSAKGAVSDAAHSAKGMAGSGKHGVTGAVSSAGRGVKGAVGGAVGATTSATKDFTGILFWLAMLGGVILLVFVPEREKQEEIWRNIRQFLGEVREMWQDLQGPTPEFDNPSSTHTM
jgi:hypothetical protein